MVEDLIQKARMRACVSDSVEIERIEQWNAWGMLENDKFQVLLSSSYLTRSHDHGSVLNSVMRILEIERRYTELTHGVSRAAESSTPRYPVPILL